MNTRGQTEPQEGPSKGPASSDQHSVSALDIASRLSGTLDRECQDLRLGRLGVPRPARICGSADFVSPRLARIADQADYSPLNPTRVARIDFVSSRPASCRSLKESTIGSLLTPAPPTKRRICCKVENFGFGQITGETLPNFRHESKESFICSCNRKGKKVFCARHSLGVGHAQDSARIPKWYSEKFVKGQWDKEECVSEWQKYKACLSQHLEDKQLSRFLEAEGPVSSTIEVASSRTTKTDGAPTGSSQ
ncbi:F-box family protein with DUF295 [Prunus dulcis]|uniref:F-box family protein with DUF295 n=1 Tax=Prunus dulcis TaxID=3755 RepID=A0A4Y1QTE4_PRUDU|nr:F-box family protein with DUF295 [Prunus dulcis]